MEEGATLRLTVKRLTGRVRQRRAVFYGLRGLGWGLALAIAPVLGRALLGPVAYWAGLAVAGAGLLAGALYGLCLRVPPADVARLADRVFGLHDRLATGLELLGRPAEGVLPALAIRDAAERARGLDLGQAVAWRWPRAVRWIPVSLAALLAVTYAPPIPLPEDLVPSLSRATEQEPKEQEKAGPPQVADRPVAKKTERAERVEVQEREYAQRQNPSTQQAKGDLAAVFKDTSVAQKRPDFSSFLKQGDERLRLLERPDSLPDLQRDFTQSSYKVMLRQSRSLMGGMDPRQLSPEKLRQLLDEMNRLGRRGGGSGGEGDLGREFSEGMEALESGQAGSAADAMERALDKVRRALVDRDKGGKGLDGGNERGGRGRDPARGGGREGEGDQDFGEGEGSLPGKGKNPGWRGDPTNRLGQSPLDLSVEGQSRKGRKEAYDTNMIGRGAQNPSRLPYMRVFSQYRKMMEDALAKESIPFDYRDQVKEYFQSLEKQ